MRKKLTFWDLAIFFSQNWIFISHPVNGKGTCWSLFCPLGNEGDYVNFNNNLLDWESVVLWILIRWGCFEFQFKPRVRESCIIVGLTYIVFARNRVKHWFKNDLSMPAKNLFYIFKKWSNITTLDRPCSDLDWVKFRDLRSSPLSYMVI